MAATIDQGAKMNTDAKVLKAKLSLNWKLLAVGPCTPADTPDGSPLGAKLYIWIKHPICPVRMLAGAFRYNAANPVPTSTTMPKYLPAELTQYVLNSFSKKSPPYHVTQVDVSTPLQRLEVEKIIGHKSVRGRGGVIAGMYETHWTGLSGPSWEREMNLQLFRHEI